MRNRFSDRTSKSAPEYSPLVARTGISSSNLLLGSMLWVGVLFAIAKVFIFPRSETADVLVQNPESAAAKTDDESVIPVAEPVVLTPGASSVRVSFPARKLPDFEFPECMGGTVSRESLEGHRWVASFVFTRCVETCPMITKSMMELHQKVAESSPEVRFVSFSVDSSYDTAEVLQKYSAVFQADHERWKFVTGDEQAIHTLIGQGFAQYAKPNIGEMRKPGFEVAHTNRVVLVNEDSIPVATFLATRPEDMVKLRRILEGKDEFPTPGPAADSNADSAPAQPMSTLEIRRIEPDDQESGAGAVQPDATDANNSESPVLEDIPADSAPAVNSSGDVNSKIDGLLPPWAKALPDLNATLNGICTVLLLSGLAAIKSSRKVLHRNLMISAFCVSVVFLASYLTYHYALGEFTGERGRRFVGSEVAAIVYRCILVPHVILAVFVPVLAVRVFQHAFAGRWEMHRKLARITFPIWLFVSVTGVVIYVMLYQWPWRHSATMVS